MTNLQVLIGKEKLKNKEEILEYLKRSIIEKDHTIEIKRSMFDHVIRLAREDKNNEFADWLEKWKKDEDFIELDKKIKELRSNPLNLLEKASPKEQSVDGNERSEGK